MVELVVFSYLLTAIIFTVIIVSGSLRTREDESLLTIFLVSILCGIIWPFILYCLVFYIMSGSGYTANEDSKNNTDNTNEEKYKSGDRFKFKGIYGNKEVMLCEVSKNRFKLINTFSGESHSDNECTTYDGSITKKELEYLFDSSYYKFEGVNNDFNKQSEKE